MNKIIVSDECVACGICVPMSEFLEELPNGKVTSIAPGTITSQEAEGFMEVIQACPVDAIKLKESSLVKSDGIKGLIELKELILHEFENFQVARPSHQIYSFNSRYVSLPYIARSGEYRYEYKSYSKAEDAGLREFDRVMYSQRKALIQQVLVEFKHNKLQPFYSYERVAGNFYYDMNSMVENRLKELMNEIKDKTDGKAKFPERFEIFEPKMNYNDYAYQFKNLEKIDIVNKIYNRIESLTEYRLYINTDYLELSGRDMYYYSLQEAIDKFKDDLLYEIEYFVEDTLDYNMDIIVETFNKAIQQELKNKTKILIETIDEHIGKAVVR